MNPLFFELLQVVVGERKYLSVSPTTEEWQNLFNMAKKHSVIAVCFFAVKLLEKQCRPPIELYRKWLAIAVQIQQRNEFMNRKCVELQELINGAGFNNCILKGQGVARLYQFNLAPNYEENADKIDISLLRQSGDIDVWVNGGLEKIMKWVTMIAPTQKVNGHHIQFNYFKNVDIELHYLPFVLHNPKKNRILQEYFASQEIKQFRNKVLLSSGESIVAAAYSFNVVFLLVHIFHHLFTEGIGLRHCMDYYFLLKNTKRDDTEVIKAHEVISDLGIGRFASALMWVLGYVFGLSRNNMLWTPNKKDGAFLLQEIMLSGNFGKEDSRQKYLYKNKWYSFWIVHFKTFYFLRFDHWAWLWSPIFRIKGKAWQKMHGYE